MGCRAGCSKIWLRTVLKVVELGLRAALAAEVGR